MGGAWASSARTIATARWIGPRSGDVAGLLAGVLLGSLAARFLGTGFLKGIFLGFMAFVTFQMAFNVRPSATRQLPGRGALGSWES